MLVTRRLVAAASAGVALLLCSFGAFTAAAAAADADRHGYHAVPAPCVRQGGREAEAAYHKPCVAVRDMPLDLLGLCPAVYPSTGSYCAQRDVIPSVLTVDMATVPDNRPSTASTGSTPSDSDTPFSARTSTSTRRTSQSLTDHPAVTAGTAPSSKRGHDGLTKGGDAGVEVIGGVQVSDDPPTKAQLKKVADAKVYAADGTAISFKSLISAVARDVDEADSVLEESSKARKWNRVLVVFVRHFFCGNCQEYIRSLNQTFEGNAVLSSLDRPTKIVVIGCGAPQLIQGYSEATMFATSSSSPTNSSVLPYRLYADPSQQLYKRLGMVRTLRLGARRPDYLPHASSLWINGFRSIVQGIKSGRDAVNGGDSKQVGGEFLFEFDGDGDNDNEDWNVLWCHRMRNTRDHTEMKQLKTVLESSSSALLSSASSESSNVKRRQDAPSFISSSSFSSTPSESLSVPLSSSSSSSASSSSSSSPRSRDSRSTSAADDPHKPSHSYASYSCSCSAGKEHTRASATKSASGGRDSEKGRWRWLPWH